MDMNLTLNLGDPNFWYGLAVGTLIFMPIYTFFNARSSSKPRQQVWANPPIGVPSGWSTNQMEDPARN